MILRWLWCILVAVGRIPLNIITRALLLPGPNWRQPPGPLANWLPIVGSLPLFIGNPSYLMLTRIAKAYGKIYRLKLGSTTVIVIGDADLLRRTFATEAVSGRCMPPLMDVMNHQGIIHAEGELMLRQRAFIQKIMRRMATPKDYMFKVLTNKASTAVKLLMRELNDSRGRPMDIDNSLSFTITNIFFATLVRATFSRDDQELLSLIKATRESFRLTQFFSSANFLPCLAKTRRHQNAQRAVLDSRAAFRKYMQASVERHRRTLDQTNPKDFIDAFLVEMTQQDAESKEFFTEPQLYAVLGDMFSTSLETISATIRWLLVALIRYPLVQDTIKAEMSRVVYENQVPNWEVHKFLPYLGATIMEGFRFSSILPIGIARGTVQDTTILGYHIPAHSMVIGLLWKIHRDPAIWRYNPNSFLPNNHLDDYFASVNKSPDLMPFSAGKRACLGDVVARVIIFHILSNIVHKFYIRSGEYAQFPNLYDSQDGILREPLPFKMRFVRRQVHRQVYR